MQSSSSTPKGYIAAINIFIAFLFALSALSAFVVAVHVLPLTDGWYETLIYLKDKGLQPYRDVEFVLPPMTLVFYDFLDLVSGNNIALHKMLGVVLSIANAAMVYLWLKGSSGRAASFASAFLFFLLETTFPIYLARDYHSLVSFFTILCLALLLPELKGPSQKGMRGMFLGGLAAGTAVQLLFLTKQNLGLLLFIAVIFTHLAAGLIVKKASSRGKNFLPHLIFITGYGLAFFAAGAALIHVLVPYMGISDFYRSLMNVESKGSPLYMITRVFHDTSNVYIITRAFIGFILIVLFLQTYKYYRENLATYVKRQPPALKQGLGFLALLFMVLLILVVIVRKAGLWSSYDLFTMAAVGLYFVDGYGFLISLGKKAEKQDGAFERIIIFGALIFANTMTASLNPVGTALILVYYLAIWIEKGIDVLSRLQPGWAQVTLFAAFILIVEVTAGMQFAKLSSPYTWWGNAEPSVFTSNASSDQKMLAGMSLSVSRVAIIDKIVSDIQKKTLPGDPILIYPGMPILYALSERLPPTRSYIQWYDFARPTTLMEDFTSLSESPPKMIVQMAVPSGVSQGHRKLLGRRLVQDAFARYLQCMVDNKSFAETDTFLYAGGGNRAGEYLLSANVPLNIEQIYSLFFFAEKQYPDWEIVGIYTGDQYLPAEKFGNEDYQTKIYSKIVVHANSPEILQAVKHINEKDGVKISLDENFIVRVLERAEGWPKGGIGCRNDLLRDMSDMDKENRSSPL